MAGQGQDFSSKAGEMTGQAQMKKDEFLNQASNPSQASSGTVQSGQNALGQATNFLQQTGEQMKNMAQGAADAVKHTLGMDNDNGSNPGSNLNNPNNSNNTSNLNNPSNESNSGNRSNPNNPTNLGNLSNPTNLSNLNNPTNLSNPSSRV